MASNIDRVQFNGLQFEQFINEEKISFAVKRMAEDIMRDYEDKDPLFIVVLNGAFIFAADLMREIGFDCKSTFVKLKSYQGLTSSGKVEKLLGLEMDLAGKDVIVLEDIVDTGNTLKEFSEQLRSDGVASLAIASLLFKKDAFLHDYQIDYIGFEIPDKFVVGYGLDYDDHGRNLKSIFQKV